jgi:hypothetical protein
MAERDPHELSEDLEREANELEQHGQEVGNAVDETRADWERKRRDDGVPGAIPPEGDGAEDSADDV